MKKLNLRLLRMIKATRGQFIAALAIIITGIFIFTALNNAALNLNNALYEYYDDTNFADIFVSMTHAPEKAVDDVKSISGVNDADGRIVIDSQMITDDDDEKVTVRLISVDKNTDNINKLYMRDGKRSITDREIIVIEQFAKGRGLKINDKITVQINGRKYEFTIKGIASSAEYVYLLKNEQEILPATDKFGVLYADEDFLKRIAGTNGSYNDIIVDVEDEKDISIIADEIEDKLKKYGVKRIVERQFQLSHGMIDQEIVGLEKMSQSVPIVFLVCAAFMLEIMLSRIIKNDRTAIGILKALGYSNREVMTHYLKYVMIVGIVGGVIGSIVGIALSGLMTKYYVIYFNIPMLSIKLYPDRAIISVLLSCVFCMVAGLMAVKGVVNIHPAESMKPESPKKGRHILLEKLPFIWNRLSFSTKVVARNINRNLKKFLFVAFSVAITFSMMIMTMWINDIWDMMFNDYYESYMKMDYNIIFNDFQDKSVVQEIKSAIGDEYIEGRNEFPFKLSYGKNEKTVNIIGLNKNSECYGLSDEDYNTVNIPDTGIILSSNLANALNAKEHDKILITNLLPDRDDEYVEVMDIIEQTLGINAYMNIDYMNELLLGKNVINGVYVITDKDIYDELEGMRGIASVQSQNDMRKMFEQFTALFFVCITFIIVFAGMLGFIIIYSMTIMSINERTTEFSSLRILGFKKIEIFNMLLKENLVATLLGLIVGLPLGEWMVKYVAYSFMTDIYTLTIHVSTSGKIQAVIYTVIFLVLAQAFTYRKIKKLNFIDALKSRIS